MDEVRTPSDKVNQGLHPYINYDDIESYIKQQWAGLMHIMLDERRKKNASVGEVLKEIDLRENKFSFDSPIIIDDLHGDVDGCYELHVQLCGLCKGAQIGIRFNEDTADKENRFRGSYAYTNEYGKVTGDGIICGMYSDLSTPYEVKFTISSFIGMKRTVRWEFSGNHIPAHEKKDRGNGEWNDTSSDLTKIQVFTPTEGAIAVAGNIVLTKGHALHPYS